MKFCAYFTEYFRIKHTEFTQDAFRFHISVVHCVGFTFSGHSVVSSQWRNHRKARGHGSHFNLYFFCDRAPKVTKFLATRLHRGMTSVYIVQVVDNGSVAELDDGSVRSRHVRTDQSHQMLACYVSIAKRLQCPGAKSSLASSSTSSLDEKY